VSITRQQAHALAGFIRTIRPTWDELLLTNILADQAHHELPDIAVAAIRTALDATKQNPVSIAWDGDHWPAPLRRETSQPPLTTHDRTSRRQAIDRCGMCDDSGYTAYGICHHDPDAAERGRRGAALARAALTQARTREDQPA